MKGLRVLLPSSPPPHGGFQKHQPVLDLPGHGLEVDGVEAPTKDLVKPLFLKHISLDGTNYQCTIGSLSVDP